jgi:predicted N-formylglutamate amidohydrolase
MIAQRYSRLVIDCNRPWAAPDLIPQQSDKTSIKANQIGPEERHMRWNEIHVPFHLAVANALDNGACRLMAVHSYDPQRDVDGAVRPWPIGLLARVSNPLLDVLHANLSAIDDINPLGINEPYRIEDASDYTIPVHAEARSIPHVLLEVRNDYLSDHRAVSAIADTIVNACKSMEPA